MNKALLKPKLIAFGILLLALLVFFGVMGVTVLTSVLSGGNAATTSLSGCRALANTAGNTSENDPVAPADIAAEQDQIVKAIDKIVKADGLDARATRVVAIAGYGESNLTNIGYGDQDTSGTRNGDGSLATSFGFLQQQTSMGYGTKEEVMNPETAARSFIYGKGTNPGLLDISGWQDMEPTAAIHAVQRNADPNHYVQYYAAADAVLKRNNIDTISSGKTTKDGGTSKDDKANAKTALNKSSCGDGATLVAGKDGGGNANNSYPWDNITPRDSWVPDPMNFYYGECVSFAGWKINETLGVKPGDPMIFTNKIAGNGRYWGKAWEQNGWKISYEPVPNSVAWWDTYGAQGIGEMGHVGWVANVKDGKPLIEEYNNSGYAGGPHRYDVRPDYTDPNGPDAPTAYLIPPTKEQIQTAGPKVGA